jgi:hypothetical protein
MGDKNKEKQKNTDPIFIYPVFFAMDNACCL